MSDLSQEWMEKLTDWRNSGLSMAAWCRQNAESYHRFIYWRDRLEPKSPTLAGNFVELPIVQSRSALSLECNGVYLNVEHGFDPGLLAEVLAVVKRV